MALFDLKGCGYDASVGLMDNPTGYPQGPQILGQLSELPTYRTAHTAGGVFYVYPF